MFLNRLNSDEKVIFLNIANLAVMIDDEATKNEDDLLRIQALECNLKEFSPKFFNLDDLLGKLEESSDISKRIILIELMAIWVADGRWDPREIEMMYKIGNSFNIPKEKVDDLKIWSIKIKETFNEGLNLIGGILP